MKSFYFITLFEEMINAYLQKGVLGQALKKNIFKYETINPRIFTSDVHKTVDDRPYGGGDGMLMLVEPLKKSVESINGFNEMKKIILTPQGKKLDHQWVKKNAQHNNWIFVCGRYAGVDQRLINHFNFEELSIGDYVISGGELPSLVTVDALLRQVPGVLGHVDSASEDSFAEGLLEAPSFTRPEQILGESVPDVLRSGDHAKINKWRDNMALIVTFFKRSDLLRLDSMLVSDIEKALNGVSDEDLKVCGIPGREILRAQLKEIICLK